MTNLIKLNVFHYRRNISLLVFSAVLSFITVLISPEAAKAQSVVIDPKSFDARRTEFTLTLDNLNPALEYRLEVSCIGLQRDYG